MLDVIYNLLERWGTWPVVALLFILFVLCSFGFDYRRKALGFENQALDSRFCYTPVEVRDFFRAIHERGKRVFYAATELTLDILFPIVYASLFSILLIRVFTPETAKILVLVPLLTGVLDLLENLTLAYLALRFNENEISPVARVASLFTSVKLILFVLSLLLILVGAVCALWRTSRS